ncbi:hypothetical protein AWV63_29265 [Micromonospora rifamycinica]|nr:hypothetical protein AWV63_29265 [Micromonospora rifamycinica]
MGGAPGLTQPVRRPVRPVATLTLSGYRLTGRPGGVRTARPAPRLVGVRADPGTGRSRTAQGAPASRRLLAVRT